MIKYFGFDFPPIGIISVLEKIAPADNKFYIVDPIGGQELPYHELDSDCWVIITTNEGSSYQWFDILIPKLQSFKVPLDHIILRSACLWDPESPIKHIHTIVDECSDFITGFTQPTLNINLPIHHFVCLNRGHRWQRYELTTQILDRALDRFGKLSYIELPIDCDQRFVALSKSDVTWHEQRNITDPEISGALFNIVTETAYEPKSKVIQPVHHHRPGMTEKSYKCFALFQIPIWLAPYRAVECYRQLGFDVFDDIVNHEYDLEFDPNTRISMVVDQIEKICNLTPLQLTQLKNDLMPRFKKNLQILKSYAHNFDSELPQWQALFSCNTVT